MPAHHNGRGFRNPWPHSRPGAVGGLLRWVGQRWMRRLKGTLPRALPASAFPIAAPDMAQPRAAASELRVTWVGHSTCLVQAGGVNILTDPVWSRRASPLQSIGPRRLVDAAFPLEQLPPIDVVLLSHNHYDHFDVPTIRALARRYPEAQWVCPLGLVPALRSLGVSRLTDLDWWDARDLMAGGVTVRVTATPAQHFSGRTPFDRDATLWCGFVVAAGPWRVYFAGDTGRHPEFERIGRELGPFDAALIPVGAYDPRWFMRPVHMDPDEALEAYDDVNRAQRNGRAPCAMVPIHWGTFKLTDEAMDEPPRRTREGWQARRLDGDALWVLRHGETRKRITP